MRLKQSIFALVAMLLCAFSATAQVTTEAELKSALTAGGDVTLGADINVTEMIEIPAGITATLDLNGHAITSGYQTESETKHIYPLDVNGDLTIKDTKGDGSITGRGIYVRTGGKLTVDGGYIYGIDANGGSALFQYGGDIVINGGHIEQKATGTTNFAISAKAGTVTVYGGWVGGNHGAISAEGAAVTIYDGEFVCTGTDGMTDNVLYTMGSGSITINGGTFIGDSDIASGGCCIYDSNGKTTVNDGTFKGTSGGDVWGTTGTTINGGTFENLTETLHVAVGATITNGGKTYTKAEDGTLVETTFVAKIGEQGYASLAEAVAAAQDGETVTLLADVTYTKATGAVNGSYVDGLVYVGDKNFTVDFAGYTITENGDINDYLVYLKNTGEKDNEITFKNGTIAINSESAATAWAAITVGSNSSTHKTTLNLNSMKVINGNPNAAGNQVIRIRNGATANLNDGTLVTSNGTSYGVVAETASVVNINDGAKVVHTNSGTTGGNLVYTAVSGNGTINIYDGAVIESDKYGIHNMTTYNAVINIYGGTITAPVAVHAATNGGAGETATVNITGGTINGVMEKVNSASSIIVSGGVYTQDVNKWCVDGYVALPDLAGHYVVGAKPTATVNNLGMTTIPAGDYSIYNGGFDQNTEDDGDMPLSFVMQFLADQNAEDMATSPYADWYGDFVITFTGIENGSFTADGCYLAGHYGSFGWVKVPVDGMKIEEGARYPVMLGVGLGQKYDYICSSVQDFKCALYLTPEILAANPNIKVNLELGVVDNSQGQDAATSALIENENVYSVTDYTYKAEDFVVTKDPEVVDGKIEFVDGEFDSYTNDTDIENVEITYKRTIDTDWNALYVPFAIPASELLDNFDIAYINDVRETDSDDDGELDSWQMELIKIKKETATLKANHPYFIRSKSVDAGENNLNITLTTTLCKATVTELTCSSMYSTYTVKGLNELRASTEFGEADRVLGYDNGETTWGKMADGYSLKPFRFYLTIEGGVDMYSNAQMSIVVRGEDGTTGVDEIAGENGETVIFDLQGRRVLEPQKGGLYIVNGKKVIF